MQELNGQEINKLESTSPELPLPVPRFIALHAACAKVAHTPGAADYTDTLCDEWEGAREPSGDGSSVDMFHQKLHLAQILAQCMQIC